MVRKSPLPPQSRWSKIGMLAKSSRPSLVPKRKNFGIRRREPSISEQMITRMERQKAEAGQTLTGHVGNHGMPMSLFLGMD
jgi:hypothetical protein